MSEPPAGGDLERLRDELARIGPMVVAFSGGADSALVARVATDTLGPERVRCATAVSPSLAPEELADCRALAAEWGLRPIEVETAELADPAYAANDGSRCYHCKTSLLEALGPRRPGAGRRAGPAAHRSSSGSTSTTWATTDRASRPPPSGARSSRW